MSTLADILSPDGAIARRLGEAYEHRPQQLEMASAVEAAFSQGRHLMAEAGTGTGKSFAYLLPAVDYAVRNKKRVVISTHTISLQEQLIDKDIPLVQAVYPEEFSAVLVKGRGNYLCRRRLEKTRQKQDALFTDNRMLESLWAIEDWNEATTDGSLATLPVLPMPGVWEKINAEAGNCMGRKCKHYNGCFWQAAKRRMQGGNLLIVNHALFFSDLALRMAGVNYLPKYDAVIFDEAHTLEDVAGQHFGIRLSEASVHFQLRSLYDPQRGKGLLTVHGAAANEAIKICVDCHAVSELLFEQLIHWHEEYGKVNGRVREPVPVSNDLSPLLEALAKQLKRLTGTLKDEEDITELNAIADKVRVLGLSLDAVLKQTMPDAVYWMSVTPKTPKRLTLHAAPIDPGPALKEHLFDKTHSCVLTSATLCTGNSSLSSCNTGFQPVPTASGPVTKRNGARLPHWTRPRSLYAITFRLADSLPANVLERLRVEAESEVPDQQKVMKQLDQGHGECWLKDPVIAQIVRDALLHFDGDRYRLMAWCVMPNHVHVIVQPAEGMELSSILHSWKRHSALSANRVLGRDGAFWCVEYYDHLIRDLEDMAAQVEYLKSNPLEAGLPDYPWVDVNQAMVQEMRGWDGHGLETRATGGSEQPVDPAFAYMAGRLGLADPMTLQLASPFDYATQVRFIVENDLPDPSEPRFMAAACEKILKHLRETRGGAFVLFTSYKQLIDAANRLSPECERWGLPMLVQGQNAPRKVLLDRFRELENAVLFGTSSFWQGVDVRGDKLRNVIIVKLPFAVPDEPLVEAKLDAIRTAGGNPFMQWQVPEAIIKLKQGFGRLIRSRTDTGRVVLLDSRVITKRYGKMFLEALPIGPEPKR